MVILDINEFEYVQFINEQVMKERNKIKSENAKARLHNSRKPKDDRIKYKVFNEELARINAHLLAMRTITKLKKDNDPAIRAWARQLELEAEYVRALNKKKLYEEISAYTGSHADGCYTLEEIGNIFGITRERVRQIEDMAKSKLKAPVNSRRLRYVLHA